MRASTALMLCWMALDFWPSGTDGLRSSGSEPKVPLPSTAVRGSVTEDWDGGVMKSKIQPLAVGVKNICGELCLPFLWKYGGLTVVGITNL